ncbi:MAG: hypothetical protein AB9866_20905 [Syntrophobacteraceae bacterium]
MHALELSSLLMDFILAAAALIAAISAAVFLFKRREYVVWQFPAALLWLLILATTACLALMLNNLLWDRIYKGQYYRIVSSFIMLLFPAVWLPLIGFFRKDRETRSVWRVVAVLAISFSILILIWVIGETL